MTKAVVTLVIYAYSSFVSPFGAGPEIVKNFEKKCDCHVELVDAGDGGSMINRLKIEGEKTRADVVLGIDENFLWRVKKDLNWNVKAVAFDHAPLSFIYNSKTMLNPPRSLDDLLDARFKGKIILEDPRLSTTGLGFLVWVIKEKGEKGENDTWDYLKKLKTQLKLITPSWDLAYGIFKKNPLDIVFSYSTSPAYHIQEEKNEDYKAAIFPNGHYEQKEYLVLNPSSKHKELGKMWQEYLLSVEAQNLIIKKNFMYPVNDKVELTMAFKKIQRPKVLEPLKSDLIEKNMGLWFKKWREIFNQ
jgi:thiamine transport system substrate-binding protein